MYQCGSRGALVSWGWVELRKQALPLFRCSSLWKPQGLNPFRQQRAEGPGVAEEVWLGAQQLMAETALPAWKLGSSHILGCSGESVMDHSRLARGVVCILYSVLMSLTLKK